MASSRVTLALSLLLELLFFSASARPGEERGSPGNLCMLVAEPTEVSSSDDVITVSWYNISFQTDDDWIGVFNFSLTPYWLAVPPIKYKSVGNNSDASGSFTFQLLNRRTDYFFAYIEPAGPYPDVQAVSQKITYLNKYAPMHVHIAAISPYSSDYALYLYKSHFNSSSSSSSSLKFPSGPIDLDDSSTPKKHSKLKNTQDTSDIDSNFMQIMWIQKEVNRPTILYGFSSDSLQFELSAHWYRPFQPWDMCDQWRGQPAGTSGYFAPGFLASVYLFDLEPDTLYFFKVGDENFGWSQVYNFTSPPKFGSTSTKSLQKAEKSNINKNKTGVSATNGTEGKISFVAFGDMGQTPIDGSKHHSWDWSNRGERYSKYVSSCIEENYLDETDFVLHIGDISYAVGYLWEWDDFFWQNENVFNSVPYYVGIGNHEFGNTYEWAPVDLSMAYSSLDSSGECGVPYYFYFPFAGANPTSSYAQRQPWYVVDYGTVRTVVMSSEHDYSEGSPQFEYVKNMMQNTNREMFPWLMVAMHRPVYVNSEWEGDMRTASYIRSVYEEMWHENKVALGFYGHHHSYARSCPIINNGTCVDDGEGMVHMVVGMAGFKLTTYEYKIPPYPWFVEANDEHYGFVHFTVENETHLYGKFIDAVENEIIDDFYVVNTYERS